MDQGLEQLIFDNLQRTEGMAVNKWKTAPHVLDIDELKSVANYGLVQAAARWSAYCQERQFSPYSTEFFWAFACKRVAGALMDYLRQSDWASRGLRARIRLVKDAGVDDGVVAAELSERTGLSLEEVSKTLREMRCAPISLDAELPNEGLPERSHKERSVENEILEEVVSFIKELDKVSQVVLVLRYYRDMSWTLISELLVLEEAQIKQIHKEAILGLRTKVKSSIDNEQLSE
jgi:RNA polymerase sigma factor for flagellar operon FliA